jgi:RsiW-degrading membrane proteinase PrsW (M82 family)
MLLFILLLVFIAIAAGLAWFLIAEDRGEKEPVGALWMAAGFGLLGAVAASFLEWRLVSANNLLPGASYGTLLVAVLAVAVIEEACKFLPLAIVIYKRRYFNEYTDGVIYFALAGLGFGLPENLLYTLQFGTKTGVVRILMTPLFHAATTGLVGYVLVKRKLTGRSPLWVGLPLAGVIGLHGLYDFGLSSGSALYAIGSLLVTLGASIGFFVAYLRAAENDQARGWSVPGYWGSGGTKALLALLFGLAGIISALFMALIGLVLGVAGLVMGTMSRSGAKRGLSTAGLVFSGVAVLASLGVWTYAAEHTPRFSQAASGATAHDITAPAVAASSLATPCYSAGFVDKLNISNNANSCDMSAYNGPTPGNSTNAYKVYADISQTANARNFTSIVKPALEKDVQNSLPNFSIDSERVAQFAGSPAYIISTSNASQHVAVTEAAILHQVDTGDNIFILVHAINGSTADLSTLEAQWQWK